MEGRSDEFIQAAINLANQGWRQRNRTDEWYRFVLDNEAALREERPGMFSQWLNEFIRLNRGSGRE
jgi:hypothetical protein